MSATTQQDQVADYLAAVRTHLADVSAPERAELLEDLEAHLREVAAEDDSPLEQRIGSPAAYAAELRASAGLTPAPARGRPSAAAAALRDRSSAIRSHPWYGAVRNFLPELRPAWWVLRGWLLAYVLAWWLFHGRDDIAYFPVPGFTSVLAVDLVLTAAAIVGSVVFARRYEPQRGSGGRALVAAQIALVLLGFATTSAVRDQVAYGQPATYASDQPSPSSEYSEYLLGPNGRITNIYPYDRDGRPLEGVLLYDGSGNPIALPEQNDIYGRPLLNEYLQGRDGELIRHAYPVPQKVGVPDTEDGPLLPQPTPSVSLPPMPPVAAQPTGAALPSGTAPPPSGTAPPPSGSAVPSPSPTTAR